jgi:Spy/CpxP family protein refolding chaperone
MNSRVKWLTISVFCSVVLAGATAWKVTDWVLHRHGESHAHDGSEPDFHAWMHEHLDITPEQHERLDPIEAEFEEQRLRLKSEIRTAGQELAGTIRSSGAEDPKLAAALAHLNQKQAELQKLTLDHFFAMKRHLRPAQAQRLLDWTHDSLTRE